jgi:hypothetical protein
MMEYSLLDLVGGASAIIAISGAIVTAWRFLGIKSRYEKMAAVREGFRSVIDSLASGNEIMMLSGAVLLRRFLQPHTELGLDKTPYAHECVLVITAILRDERQLPEAIQKILADSLAYAPNLRAADFQRTNLRNAYLGDRIRKGIDVSDADFYRANLTKASLKGITAKKTVFYKSVLKQSVLRGADLTGADFRQANLEGADFDQAELLDAQFDDAVLAGARFKNARNLPTGITDKLDRDGVYTR